MKKHKKKIIWIVIILVIVGGGYFYSKNKKTKTTYVASNVEIGDLAQTVSVTGEIVPNEEANLSFKSSGIVENVFVEVGDKVVKGQKLAALDRASLNSMLKQNQEDINFQKETLDNMQNKNRRIFTADQRSAQKSLVRKAGESYHQTLLLLKDNNLYSPIDGVVSKRNIEIGEISPLGGVIFTVFKEGNFEIEANVPESDIVNIALEQPARITLDALSSNEILNAKVSKIDPSSTVIQDVVYYKIKLTMIDPDARIKDGMSADIDVQTAKRQNVLKIPQRAIKNDGKQYVEVLKDEKQNIIDKVYITVGLEGDEGMVEVTSGNLKEGDKVITLSSTK